MKLGMVEFVFENCEVMSIHGKYFSDFYIDNINTYFKRIAANAIEKIDEAGTIVLSIHKDADEEYHSFGLSSYKTTKFDRILAYNDITLIRFFLDGKEYSYRIKWDDDMMSENLNQASQKSRFGHLYLVISDNALTNMKEYFPEETINDEDYEFDQMDLWED
jgi:hypothetical protein